MKNEEDDLPGLNDKKKDFAPTQPALNSFIIPEQDNSRGLV